MKQIIIIPIFILVAVLIFSSCKPEEKNPSPGRIHRHRHIDGSGNNFVSLCQEGLDHFLPDRVLLRAQFHFRKHIPVHQQARMFLCFKHQGHQEHYQDDQAPFIHLICLESIHSLFIYPGVYPPLPLLKSRLFSPRLKSPCSTDTNPGSICRLLVPSLPS